MAEDDYMSDIFIQTSDHKSTLNKSKNLLRKRKLEKNKSESDLKNKLKPKHIIEHEQREKGLATSISSDNLGFKLMQKMGYKNGEGLGKKGDGRFEPVPIVLKGNRFGFGKESRDKDRIEARKKLLKIVAEKTKKLEQIRRNDFRARMSQKYTMQQTERDFQKSQNACHQLDSSEDIEEPLYEFFWPSFTSSEDDDDDDISLPEEFSTSDKLSLITNYLREQYYYCIWCASKYDDFEDLCKHCPGDTASAHDEI